jgi:pimeloyl-ACP methyl ester carboxylesterase
VPSARSSPGVAGRGPAATQNQELGPIRESILQFDNIFGIVSEPVAAVSGAPTILLPNAGATHHVGPNRLYVVIARQLARAGFRVLRFDLPGLGDSFIDDPEKENDSYYPEASMIIERAMAAMSGQSFVVTGLCSGAHASFHAAMDLERAPIAETILINPLTFYYHAGMSLDQPSTAHYAEWQWYMQSMRSMERWRKLLRGEARIGSILRTAAKRFQDIAGRKFRRTKAVNDLAADLRRITEAGRRLTFVFSRFDPGYDLLTINAGSALKRLQKRGLVKLWRIDNATHTFEAKHSRDQMIESLKTHLTDRYVSGVRRP